MSWMKLLAVAAGFAGLMNAPLAAEDDFARDRGIILERLRDIGPDGGDDLLQNFRDDGTWSDIDYTNLSRGSWKPMAHLSRARSLARRHPEIALKALAAWDRMRLRSLNWWGVCIGVPDLITDTRFCPVIGDFGSSKKVRSRVCKSGGTFSIRSRIIVSVMRSGTPMHTPHQLRLRRRIRSHAASAFNAISG